MVNENIQGVIPIAGRGMIRRTHGSYEPGEFHTLVNCEISNQGTIVPRRKVRAVTADAHTLNSTNHQNLNTIVGHYKNGVIVSGLDKMAYARSDAATFFFAWDNTEVRTDRGGNCLWAKLCGFIRYNKVNYWLFQCYFESGANKWFEYWLYYAAEANIITDDITSLNTLPTTKVRILTTDTTLTETQRGVLGGSSGRETLTPEPIVTRYETVPFFRGFFLHKERFWLVTSKQVVFSKATDPTVWTVPEGGFFNFIESNINAVSVLKDSLYVICDNSIKVITYSLDSNSLNDVTVKEIADSMGGDASAVVSDLVYVIRDESLYAISDKVVTRVLDMKVNTLLDTNLTWRLVAFGKYLIALRVRATKNQSYPTATSPESTPPASWNSNTLWDLHYASLNAWDPAVSNTDGAMFFINTENGCVHGFSYSVPTISDMYFCPVETSGNEQLLYILGKQSISGTTTSAEFAFMSLTSDDYDLEPNDTTLTNTTGTSSIDNIAIQYILEIQKYVPDGSVLFMKKFRNFLLEGIIPDNFQVQFLLGESNTEWTTAKNLDASVIGTLYLPLPIRIGINQRGRSLGIRLFTKTDGTAPVSSPLTISRLVALWSYVGRGPTSRNWGNPDEQSA